MLCESDGCGRGSSAAEVSGSSTFVVETRKGDKAAGIIGAIRVGGTPALSSVARVIGDGPGARTFGTVIGSFTGRGTVDTVKVEALWRTGSAWDEDAGRDS